MSDFAEFDPEDQDSWYFGEIKRGDAEALLMKQRDNGVFLVRKSERHPGDFVLCVKEEKKIAHYIINHVKQNSRTPTYRIGQHEFDNLPTLLRHYKTHYLDSSPLTKPVPKPKVRAKYEFQGKDAEEDLPFKKDEILTVLEKTEEEWWLAKNGEGKKGLIPRPYVEDIDDVSRTPPQRESRIRVPSTPSTPLVQMNFPQSEPDRVRSLPAKAVVIRQRIPNLYERQSLRLEVGDIVEVIKMNMDGQWEGIVNGKQGMFPFTHVKWLDDDVEEEKT